MYSPLASPHPITFELHRTPNETKLSKSLCLKFHIPISDHAADLPAHSSGYLEVQPSYYISAKPMLLENLKRTVLYSRIETVLFMIVRSQRTLAEQ
jgi:hypothetical protein